MNILAAVSSTSTSTTAAAPVCEVYPAGNYVGNCIALRNYFSPPVWYTDLWMGLLGAVVVLGAFAAIRVYYEYPLGRFFWHKKGIKAVMHFHGAPGVFGMLYPYLDKIFLFISSGSERKKNRIVRLIPAVPGAITHMRQEDGGDSFVTIQGDKGLPVSPELEAWAEKHLNELAASHDWNHFALRVKRDLLHRDIAEAKLFPKVKDWNPGTDIINLVTADGTLITKQAIEVNKDPDAKAWYLQKSEWAEQLLKNAAEQEAKTQAILNGDDFYLMPNGQKVMLPPRKKSEWVRLITEEIANLKGEVGRAVLGGTAVGVQYVANVLSNVPDGIYFDSAKAEVEEKVRKEMKKKADDIIKTAIAAVIVLGGIGIIMIVISKYAG